MKRFLLLFLITFSSLKSEPIRLIFDTDMGNDIDDAMALAMIHALQDKGAVKLLAVTSTKNHPLSTAFIDCLNTFYGRPEIPVGAVSMGVTPEQGRYLGMAELKDAHGRWIYPRGQKNGHKTREAVALLRKTLASQPDHSVTIAQVGFFTNLCKLLESQGDDVSPLNGYQLVQKKVKELGVMAGAFEEIDGNGRYLEYNVKMDLSSAQSLAKKWPGKIIWSGFEIGIAARYPWESIQKDYNYLSKHLIKEGYLAYCPKGEHRPTWDLTTVLQLVYPERGYFSLSEVGMVRIEGDAFTRFEIGKGQHQLIRMDEKQALRVREAFVQLCSTPPAAFRGN